MRSSAPIELHIRCTMPLYTVTSQQYIYRNTQLESAENRLTRTSYTMQGGGANQCQRIWNRTKPMWCICLLLRDTASLASRLARTTCLRRLPPARHWSNMQHYETVLLAWLVWS